MTPSLTLRSLPVRLVVSFVGLVILTALAVGIPAIFLIRAQLDNQAQRRVVQGVLSTQALLKAQQNELTNLAMLTSQRPTLGEFITGGAATGLQSYLETLRSGADLDLIALCASDGSLLAQAGEDGVPALCTTSNGTRYYSYPNEVSPSGATSALWLISAHALEKPSQGTVLVGLRLDDAFAADLFDQTGLQHILLANGQLAATNFSDETSISEALSHVALAESSLAHEAPIQTFTVEEHPYYAVRIQLDEMGAEDVAALSASEVFETQRQLSLLILESMGGIALVGTFAGILIARLIGRPLSELRDAAAALQKGELSIPVRIPTRVPEVSIVASALEDSRVALQHTLAELRRERDWIEHLLESIVEGIVTLDQRGRITYFSRGAERITGWAQKDTLGRACDEIFHLVDGNSFNQFVPLPDRQQKVTLSLRDGRQTTLAVTGARLAPPDAGNARVALVLRDVTEEDAMRHLLGDFLANITHEFRTPLSALAASSELLLDQVQDLSHTELQELLGSLHLGILGLQTLIDNLLEGASIEAGRFRVYPRAADLGDLVQEGVATMQPLASKYGQRVVFTLPADLPPVNVDYRRTIQVLVNLISNAIKFGPPDSRITLTATRQPDSVRIAVSDQGPGIPPEHQAGLFQRIVHARTGNEKAQYGAGLGLSVVRAIVEAQGGLVGAKNREEGGAVFWFTVPFVRKAE